MSFALIFSDGFPLSYEEAVRSSEKEGWMEAMVEELESLKKKHGNLCSYPKTKGWWGANGYTGRKRLSLRRIQKSTKLG